MSQLPENSKEFESQNLPKYIMEEQEGPPSKITEYYTINGLRGQLDEPGDQSNEPGEQYYLMQVCPAPCQQKGQLKNTGSKINLFISISVAVGLGGSFVGLGVAYEALSHRVCSLFESSRVTLADYEKLQAGMSRTDIEATLSPGVEISKSPDTTRLEWENCDGSTLEIVLANGVLVNKQQSELK